MFIKPLPKYNKTTKERYTVYHLCESYRFDGHIRHRTIIGFGKLDELSEEGQKKQLALRIEEMLKYGVNYLSIGAIEEKDKLYSISHQLYSVKDKLEQYLSWQTNELFDLEDKIILYDLTNTYFEP